MGERIDMYEECVDNFNRLLTTSKRRTRHIGSGVHRAGYEFNQGRCVMKIPTSFAGVAANRSELQIFFHLSPRARTYFNPIEDWDRRGAWISQRKITPLLDTGYSDEEISDLRTRLEDGLENLNIFCGDLHTGNIGENDDGDIVILDYAGARAGAEDAHCLIKHPIDVPDVE